MLKLYYSKNMLEKNLKTGVEELAGNLSQLYNFDIESQQNYLENVYEAKIVGIASNLGELMKQDECRPAEDVIALLQSTDKFDNFDPRYVQNFDGKWTKDIDEKARISQNIIDIAERYDLCANPETKFILLNSLKYLSGKEIDIFQLNTEQIKETNLMNLTVQLGKKFDYLECPFDATMDGFCSVFSKDKNIYARFKRENFEIYLLHRFYQEYIVEILSGHFSHTSHGSIDEVVKGCIDYMLIKIGGIYSDTAVEKLEPALDTSIVASLFVSNALNNSVRTKTHLEFDGREREYFLTGGGLFADRIYIKSAGCYALSSEEKSVSEYNIKKLIVDNCGNDLGIRSNFNCEEAIFKQVGDRALKGDPKRFSNHKINRLFVENTGVMFGACSNFKCDEVYIKQAYWWLLEGGEDTFSEHHIEKLTIEKTGKRFGFHSKLHIDRNNLKLSKGVKFKGKIYAKDKKWWEFWVHKGV